MVDVLHQSQSMKKSYDNELFLKMSGEQNPMKFPINFPSEIKSSDD